MTPDDLLQVMEATWPPARTWEQGPVTLRADAGGGQRVSAASVRGDFTEKDIANAVKAMANPLFLIQEGQHALDAELAGRGYRLHDPVVAYAADIGTLAGDLPPLAAFPHWPPLQIARDIWEDGDIGPARLAVMERVVGPKAAILARASDRPAGIAFVAVFKSVAMVHALEVRPAIRRRGVGAVLMRAAANWGVTQGAARLALVVTEQNLAARALYAFLGMEAVGQYHYRAG
jgi:GNAT superfamily N-acetyltransferase